MILLYRIIKYKFVFLKPVWIGVFLHADSDGHHMTYGKNALGRSLWPPSVIASASAQLLQPLLSVALTFVNSCLRIRARLHCCLSVVCFGVRVRLLRRQCAFALTSVISCLSDHAWFASSSACGCFDVRAWLHRRLCAVALASLFTRGCFGSVRGCYGL